MVNIIESMPCRTAILRSFIVCVWKYDVRKPDLSKGDCMSDDERGAPIQGEDLAELGLDANPTIIVTMELEPAYA